MRPRRLSSLQALVPNGPRSMCLRRPAPPEATQQTPRNMAVPHPRTDRVLRAPVKVPRITHFLETKETRASPWHKLLSHPNSAGSLSLEPPSSPAQVRQRVKKHTTPKGLPAVILTKLESIVLVKGVNVRAQNHAT